VPQTDFKIDLSKRQEICDTITAAMKKGARAHLIGIGGVSMCPLAEELHRLGLNVTGSDEHRSELTDRLVNLGIPVSIGHDAANVHGADFVIRTAAARDTNTEVTETRRLGLPLFERAEVWGAIMRRYNNAICVSGCHGKTTTTTMISEILLEAKRDPSIMIGGTVARIGGGYRVGNGNDIVLESCEYYNSFLSFYPTVSLILNIDNDHLDYFGNLENIKKSFRTFAELTPENGTVICSGDDENTADALAGLDRRVLTFGFGENCDVRGSNYTVTDAGSEFDVSIDKKPYCHIALNAPGKHNVANALAALAAAGLAGIPAEVTAAALLNFQSADRRFQYKGTVNGAAVYDDYAHHPTELKALLDLALDLPRNRLIIAFQPHTYSRTASHLSAFAEQLSRADICIVSDIYAARETNIYGVKPEALTALVLGSEYIPDFGEIERRLRQLAGEGDIIITVGAGELYKVADAIVAKQ